MYETSFAYNKVNYSRQTSRAITRSLWIDVDALVSYEPVLEMQHHLNLVFLRSQDQEHSAHLGTSRMIEPGFEARQTWMQVLALQNLSFKIVGM